ncbi:hypothetical protein TNCV_2709901 [Trichonephila clavipes]|nr:hypothetical protein TNCV_2709901 [Trichonephila clavipes]
MSAVTRSTQNFRTSLAEQPPTKKWAGVNALKLDGCGKSSVRGLELRQASICINMVEPSSKLRITELIAFMSNCLALLMADSHKPPKRLEAPLKLDPLSEMILLGQDFLAMKRRKVAVDKSETISRCTALVAVQMKRQRRYPERRTSLGFYKMTYHSWIYLTRQVPESTDQELQAEKVRILSCLEIG